MNANRRPDDSMLNQIDRVLETDSPSDEPLINTLAHTRPKADRAFQQELEQMLMAQLQPQAHHNKEHDKMISTARYPNSGRLRPVSIAPLTIMLASLALALIGIVLMNWNPLPISTGAPSTVTQPDTPVTLVIATQDIEAGTTITDAMIGVISLSQADMDELRITQEGREFITDVESVIGQTAAFNISWMQPIQTDLLGEVFDPCGVDGAVCLDIPEGYATIMLSALPEMVQGLENGDRVDVLAAVDGQLRVLTSNVLLMDITPGMVTLAAPYWQHTILVWLFHSGESYSLRLYTGDAPEPVDETPIDFVFTAPEPLPDDYVFDLIVNVPTRQGYLLTGLPTSIDNIPFTSNGDTLYFWFKDFELVNIEDGITVTIRLAQGDADNLEYLIETNADLTFIPDADSFR